MIVHTADKSPKIDVEAEENGVYAVFRKGESTFKLLELIRCVARPQGGVNSERELRRPLTSRWPELDRNSHRANDLLLMRLASPISSYSPLQGEL